MAALMLGSYAGAQTHTFPALDTDNEFTAKNTFDQGIIVGAFIAATLPGSPTNGQQVYCSDCQLVTPCVGGGTGAIAQRVNSAWACATGSGSGGSGIPYPGSPGIVFATGALATRVSTSADIIALWTGSCSATSFFRGDGACSGDITLASGALLKFSSDTGVSRCSANAVCLGNGSAADHTAQVKAGSYIAGTGAGGLVSAGTVDVTVGFTKNSAPLAVTDLAGASNFATKTGTENLTNKSLGNSAGFVGATSGSPHLKVDDVAGNEDYFMPTDTGGTKHLMDTQGVTATNIPYVISGNLFATSHLFELGTSLTITEAFDIQGNAIAARIPNCTGSPAGTSANKLAKLGSDGAGGVCATISLTTDSTGIIGIVNSGSGTSGNAKIARLGQGSCVFDGATTAMDYVQRSSTVDGACHDAGASRPVSGQIFGQVTTTNGSGGTYNVLLTAPGLESFSTTALIPFIMGCTGAVGTGTNTSYAFFPFNVTGSGCNIASGVEANFPVLATCGNFRVNAGAAGGGADSGVVALWKAGSQTALKCTLGTGTSCTDLVDFVGFSAGDLFSVRVTTGTTATDTTANIRVTFTCS